MKSTFLSLSAFILAAAALLSTARAGVSVQDVDGKAQSIPAPGRLSIVMYTNADLEQESKALSKTLDPYRGARNFMFYQVVDLRGEIPGIARRMAEKQIRKELDIEAARVKPFYAKNGSSANPRADLSTVVDYGGSVLSAFGWNDRVEMVRFVIYDSNGNVVRRIDDTKNVQSVASYFRSLLGSRTASADGVTPAAPEVQ